MRSPSGSVREGTSREAGGDRVKEVTEDGTQGASVDPQLQARVAGNINSVLGEELTGLAMVTEYQAEVEARIKDIEIRLNAANSSVNNELTDALGSGEGLEKKVEDLFKQQKELKVKASATGAECRSFAAENRKLLTDIACVRGVTQYTLWLQLIEQVGQDLSVSMETADKTEIIIAYNKLKQIAFLLKDSKCLYLREFVEETKKHWYLIITEKYVTLLTSALEVMGWPIVDSADNSGKTLKDLMKIGASDIKNLQDSVETLLKIQDPLSEGEFQFNFPMKILMKPLRKRFKFHFLGSKATNNPAKPEWFTTQLTTWALSHRYFLTEYIQPVYDRTEQVLPANMEFGQALVSLAIEKLEVDVPIVVQDDVLFAHTIDETIGFARDIGKNLQYSSSQPSVLEPLTRPHVFSRWLNMERKFAFEKVDNLFMEEGNSAWESQLGDSLTPRAAESFLALLLSVTERYKFLSDIHHRLEFLNLQIDLIEDFRVRLVQLVRSEKENPLASNLCPIVNTLDHLILVLGNWAETPFFLQLEYERCRETRCEMTETVFEEKIAELQYFQNDMVQEIVDSIYYLTIARTVKYRSETKWFSVGEVPNCVTDSVCDMLQTLTFSLETGRKQLGSSCFERVWQALASKLENYIICNIVLNNKFNLNGGKQLEVDIRQGLFPIFGEFSPCPLAHFQELMDVLQLLTSSAATLILTRDGILDTTEIGANNILGDLGVHNITRDQALKVIAQRIDLDIN